MRETLSACIQAAKDAERAGAWDRALEAYERAFRRLAEEGDAADAADVLRWIGTTWRERGDPELAGEAYEASLHIAVAARLPAREGAALNCLAIVAHLGGDTERARDLYRAAGAAAADAGDDQLAAMVHQNLGALANLHGDLPAAVGHYRVVLDRCERTGNTPLATRTLNNLGMAQGDLGELDEAEASFAHAERLAAGDGDLPMQGTVALNRADLWLKARDWERARACCDRALEVFGGLRSKPWIGEAYKVRAVLYRETGRQEEADAHFAMALGLAESAGNRLLQAETRLEWALLKLSDASSSPGIAHLNHALRLFGELRAEREVADIRRAVQRAEGLYHGAVREWSAGLERGERGHGARVAAWADALAGAAGVAGWERTALVIGALVHDVGHSAVPGDGREPLPGAEAAPGLHAIHPVAGDRIAGHLAFPDEVQAVVRGHHEAWDGGGFPDGLRGEEIPRAARIVAVADAYAHLTAPRETGGGGLAHPLALRRLRALAGRTLDPALTDAFAALAEARAAAA